MTPEFPLIAGNDIRNNYYQARMNIRGLHQFAEVASIVGDYDQILLSGVAS